MHLKRVLRRARRKSAGLSLIELMVGVAVSLFIVAAASMLVSTQLTDNRRLLLETQLQQDLRATADIITRDLRRSGFWQNAQNTVPAAVGNQVEANSYLALSVDPAASSAVSYRYRRSGGVETFGFKLENGVIKSCQGETALNCEAGWQDLTDTGTVQITAFSVDTVRAGTRARPANGTALTLPCPSLCADGTTSCWPSVAVRELTVTITGVSRSDNTVRRTLTTSVRVRNDGVALSSEAPSNRSCPVS
jgi:type IV pilus assembly protein PilW